MCRVDRRRQVAARIAPRLLVELFEGRVGHAGRPKNSSVATSENGLAGRRLDHEAGEDEVRVGIDILLARLPVRGQVGEEGSMSAGRRALLPGI